MLTLYHAPRSRSSRIVWLLEELGAAYRIKTVSIRRRDPAAQDPLKLVGTRDPVNVHPHGKVPALVHDGVVISESAAIVLYLTDLYPQARLGPPIGHANRGPYLSWLAYYTGVMGPAFTSAVFEFNADSSTVAWVPVPAVMEHVNDTLAKGPYLLGQSFSAADILVGSAFILFLGSPLCRAPICWPPMSTA